MKFIEKVTVPSGGAASITFSAIPDTFTDLVVKLSVRGSSSNTYPRWMLYQFNGSTSGYSARTLVAANTLSPASYSLTTGTTNSLTGGRLGDGWIAPSNATASTFSNATWYIPNYKSSVAKSHSFDGVSETNGTGPWAAEIIAGLWTGTDAITSITISVSDSMNFVEHSTASLFGVLAGSDGIVTVS